MTYPAVANLYYPYDDTPGAEQSTLYKMFAYAFTTLNGNPFEHIYFPYQESYVDNNVLKYRDSFADIGVSTATITDIFYTTYFNRKFFREIKRHFDTGEYINSDNYAKEFGKWISSVYMKNSPKYLGNIALLGYKYDPLYNYDMNETSGSWIKDGDNKIETTPSGTVTTEHDRTQYDNTNYVHESKDVTTYANAKTTTDEKHQHISDTITSANDIYGSERSNLDKLAGGKIRRYGNIGVTTTQQMIEQERNKLKFSIINDFFNDLDTELLLNIYE
jgi:hypothetical protein